MTQISSHWRHAAFVLAMAFLLATQSRSMLGGIGLGELFGLVFVLMCFGQPVRMPLWAPWLLLLFFTGFLVGAVLNMIHGASGQVAARDLAALLFAIIFALCTVLHLQTQAQPGVALAHAVAAAALVQAVPLILLAAGTETGAWLTDTEHPGLPFLSRYIGFSENPNQLGVLLCAFPFLIGHALMQARGWRRVGWLLVLVVGIIEAALIKSNTVFAAYILCATLAVLLYINRWHLGPKAGVSQVGLSAGLILVMGAAVAFVMYAVDSVSKTGDADANGRFQRWEHALQGITQSMWMGVGPGGQSGETGPFQGEEAHNFWLDITLQGGALSLLAYLALLLGASAIAWRKRSLMAVCVLLAIVTQQVAHYTARQPMAWVYLLLPFALLMTPPRAQRPAR